MSKRNKIGYKVCCVSSKYRSISNEFMALVTLRIDGEIVDPHQSIPVGQHKVRTNKAKVIKIQELKSNFAGLHGTRRITGRLLGHAYSPIRGRLKYVNGRIVKAKLDRSLLNICGMGINFFWNKRDAQQYYP